MQRSWARRTIESWLWLHLTRATFQSATTLRQVMYLNCHISRYVNIWLFLHSPNVPYVPLNCNRNITLICDWIFQKRSCPSKKNASYNDCRAVVEFGKPSRPKLQHRLLTNCTQKCCQQPWYDKGQAMHSCRKFSYGFICWEMFHNAEVKAALSSTLRYKSKCPPWKKTEDQHQTHPKSSVQNQSQISEFIIRLVSLPCLYVGVGSTLPAAKQITRRK